MDCPKCHVPNIEKASFCNRCGSKLQPEIVLHKERNVNKYIKKFCVFFFVIILYIVIINLLPIGSGTIRQLAIDVFFAGVVGYFFVRDYKEMMPLIHPRRLKFWPVFLIILFEVGFSLLVFVLAHKLRVSVYKEDFYYLNEYNDSFCPLFFAILSVGIFPAVNEEIAVRGILFNDLRSLASPTSVIIITSVVFTILHISSFSFLWIFPMALVYGYFRHRYKTILIGVIGHFFYNTFIIIWEYLFLHYKIF